MRKLPFTYMVARIQVSLQSQNYSITLLDRYAGIISPRLFQDKVLNPALAKALPRTLVSGSEAGDMDMDANLLKSITGNESQFRLKSRIQNNMSST